MRVKYRNVYIVLVLIALLGLTGCSYDDVLELFDFSGSKGESTITIEKDSGNADCADMPIIVMHTDDDMKISIEPVIEEETALPWQEEVWDDVNKIYSKSAASPTEITLGFAGDICFYDEYANMSTLRSQANGIYDCILEGVMNGLKAVDIMMVNNEFAYSDRGTPTAGKKYAFRSKPSNVSMLDDMGVDIVSLANNHAYDWGPDALMDTFDILTEAKVPYVGAGRNIDEAVKPVYYKINGKTIAYTSATQIERLANPDTKEATSDSPGVLRTLDPSRFVNVIQQAKENSDFVVVYVHWGSENTDLVEASQRELAKKYAAAGADLIIGDHPHCLQGIDYVDGVPVIYSLGNFWFNSKTVDTGYIKATLDGDCNLSTLQFIPCVQEGCKTRLALDDKKSSILKYMQGISDYAQIDEEGYITRSDTSHNTQNGQNTSPSKKSDVEETGAVDGAANPATNTLTPAEAASDAVTPL